MLRKISNTRKWINRDRSNNRRAKPDTLISLVFFIVLLQIFPSSLPALASPASFEELSPQAQEVAIDIGIDDEIRELLALKAKKTRGQGDATTGDTSSLAAPERARGIDRSSASSLDVGDPDALRILLLRQEISESILQSILEVRTVIARLDEEGTAYNALKAYMEDKRDRSIRINNISNFLSNGALTMASNGWEIPPGETPETVGAMIGAASGAVTTGISAWALKLSGGEKRSSGVAPNMLAKFFNFETGPDNDYPREVWRFLTDTTQAPGESRKSALIKRWVELKRIEEINTTQGKLKLARICGTVPQSRTVNIDLLDDRVSMLADVKATVSLMFNQLLELMRAVHGKKR